MVFDGSRKLSALVRLKISTIASSWPWGPAANAREMRTSHEKYALSLRRVLRRSTCPSAQLRSAGEFARCPAGGAKGLNGLGPQLADAGCAEYRLTRLFTLKPLILARTQPLKRWR